MDIKTTVPSGSSPALRVVVERFDGLVLVDEAVPIPPGSRIIGLHLPGALAEGTYKVTGELSVDGRPAATRSQVFELMTTKVHSGGRPALAYPYSIVAEALDV